MSRVNWICTATLTSRLFNGFLATIHICGTALRATQAHKHTSAESCQRVERLHLKGDPLAGHTILKVVPRTFRHHNVTIRECRHIFSRLYKFFLTLLACKTTMLSKFEGRETPITYFNTKLSLEIPDLVSLTLSWCHDTEHGLPTSCSKRARYEDIVHDKVNKRVFSRWTRIGHGASKCTTTSWRIILRGTKSKLDRKKACIIANYVLGALRCLPAFFLRFKVLGL